MFSQVLGLPAHPLLVHAAVVFVPLLALGAIAYAVVPRLRGRIRWAVVLLAVVAPGAAFLAERSGDAFRERLISKNLAGADMLAKISQHEAYGKDTMLLAALLGVVTLALAFAVGDGAPLARWRGARSGGSAAAAPIRATAVPAGVTAGSAGAPGGGTQAGTADAPTAGTGAHAAAAGAVGPSVHGGSHEGPSAATGVRVFEVALSALAVVLALVTAFYVYRTGDSGARIVWSGF